MQKIAYAKTATQFDKNVEELIKSSIYKGSAKVQDYCEKKLAKMLHSLGPCV